MSYKPILVVAGEPNSIFLEIFFKTITLKKFKSPIILICSLKVLKLQMQKLNFKKKIKLIDPNQINAKEINNNFINLINIKYNPKRAFEKVSSKSKKYIDNSFLQAFKIIKKYNFTKFINGPINKKKFLNKNELGMTEYISKKFNIKKKVMLIYNKELSVSPITTHLPIKFVTKKISKKIIIEKIKLINKFYKSEFNIAPKMAVLGLNPHCESISSFNEDEKIIKPAINYLKKLKLKISGPFPADTLFTKNNRSNYDVIIGMYHDQVLTPIKTLFEYDAINITLGLPFIRISPDHGPNEKMLGKNKSNPLSLIRAISFLDKN